MNIGILLAAGTSARFHSDVPKQLYLLNGKKIVDYSIEVMSDIFDQTIVVANSLCYDKIDNSIVLVNDINCRFQSIKTAMDYIGDKDVSNVIIHDAARPFVPKGYFSNLLKSSEEYQCSQYCLKLVNGLVKKNNEKYDVVNRDDYIELCTPQIIDYKIFKNAFYNYIYGEKSITCEIVSLVDLLGIKYNLIEGHYRQLRKITTLDDIY